MAPEIPHALCPVCNRQVATHDGRLVRHKGDQMQAGRGRWFRETCRGSGRAEIEGQVAPQPRGESQ